VVSCFGDGRKIKHHVAWLNPDGGSVALFGCSRLVLIYEDQGWLMAELSFL
jgi:hypothetical protein